MKKIVLYIYKVIDRISSIILVPTILVCYLLAMVIYGIGSMLMIVIIQPIIWILTGKWIISGELHEKGFDKIKSFDTDWISIDRIVKGIAKYRKERAVNN